MKAFFKPSFAKIILTFILFVIASLFWRQYVISTISDTFPWGFPLQFYLAWGPCPPSVTCSESNMLFLVLDIVIWYLASAFMISMVKKRKIAG